MMNPPENKRPVTVEDLLRFKRAERPSPEFWSKFEAQLRAKQLAAIVEKRPWWRTISVAGVMRHRVLLGSTALLAISFVSIREYRKASPRSQQPVETSSIVSGSHFPDGSSSSAPVQEAAVALTPPAMQTATTSVDSGAASVVAAVSSREIAADQTVYAGGSVEAATVANTAVDAPQAAQWLLAMDRSDAGGLSPTARSIADNLAAAKEAHPELTNRFFGVSGFEKRSMPASRQTVDPLSQMRSPSELHRERLLASAVPASATNLARNSDRVIRRISDERLTEEAISRFDARGDRLLVKF
jgi:hypothetical protein